MAILKSTTTPHGIQADYFKLTQVKLDAVQDLVTLNFALYASAEAREAGGIPLWHEQVFYKMSELSMNPMALFYGLATQVEVLKDGKPDTVPQFDLIQHVPPAPEPMVQDPHAEARVQALKAVPSVGAYKGGV